MNLDQTLYIAKKQKELDEKLKDDVNELDPTGSEFNAIYTLKTYIDAKFDLLYELIRQVDANCE